MSSSHEEPESARVNEADFGDDFDHDFGDEPDYDERDLADADERESIWDTDWDRRRPSDDEHGLAIDDDPFDDDDPFGADNDLDEKTEPSDAHQPSRPPLPEPREVLDFAATDAEHCVPLGVGANGRIIWNEAFFPVAVFGPPRKGKTRNVATPIVASWSGAALVLSARDDLTRLTIRSRQRRGSVYVIDPSGSLDPTGDIRATPIDFLASCRTLGGAKAAAHRMVTAGSAIAGMREGEFWYATASRYLVPRLLAAALGGFTLADCISWIRTRESFAPATVLNAHPDGAIAAESLHSSTDTDERMHSSIIESLLTALSAFEDPAVLAAFSGDLDLADAIAQPGATVYLIAPLLDQGRLAPVFTALIGHVIKSSLERHVTERRATRLLVLVDEAGNVGEIPDLPGLSTMSAGCGLQLVTCWQSLSQVRTIYGPDRAHTMLGTTHALLFLPTRDTEAAAMLDPLIGDLPSPSLPDGQGVARLRRVTPGSAVLVSGEYDPCQVQLLTPEDAFLKFDLGL